MRCAPERTRLVACCLQARNACTHYVLMCKFTALISKKQINSTYYALFVLIAPQIAQILRYITNYCC